MRDLLLSSIDSRAGTGAGIVNGDPTLERIAKGNGLALCAAGSWTARFAPVLEQMVADAEKLAGSRANIFIDVSQVSKLDTFGAWLIERLRRSLTQGGVEAQIAGLSANYSSLVDEVRRVKADARRRHQYGDRSPACSSRSAAAWPASAAPWSA